MTQIFQNAPGCCQRVVQFSLNSCTYLHLDYEVVQLGPNPSLHLPLLNLTKTKIIRMSPMPHIKSKKKFETGLKERILYKVTCYKVPVICMVQLGFTQFATEYLTSFHFTSYKYVGYGL